MSAKLEFIEAYFKRWNADLAKARELLEIPRFHLEAWLILSCYIGAFASLRFPSMRDGEAFVRMVLEYSGKREFYEQVDLLFLFQWPRSKLHANGMYKSMKQHTEVVAVLERIYGSEGELKSKTRYVEQATLVTQILATAIPGFDEANFRKHLPLFSLAEQLYRYVRCDAVHNADFPLLNEVAHVDGSITYKHNHAITSNVLYETASGIFSNLHKECATQEKWPHEL
jgi:hypothetical protein